MLDLENFRNDLIEEIKFQVNEEGKDDVEALLDYYKGILIDAEEIDDINYIPFEGIGRRKAKIKIDGYSYQELDNILSIFICTPISYGNVETLTKTEAMKYFSRAQAFIMEKKYILENCEESSAGYGFAYDLVHNQLFNNIRKYRIYLFTDSIMSDRIRDIESGSIDGVTVEYTIWDASRIFQIVNSKSGKEDIEINLLDYSEHGIPCLPASQTEDYVSYLCNIPGLMLANLYNAFGSRLLEGNVRSFLQTKGKVNKGIRNTILNQPSLFFAFNNGIAATASEIHTSIVDGNLYIDRITALQIVNGGQTTASLAMALLNDKKDNSEQCIRKISVPMKLSLLSPEKGRILIPLISRYANSQNKVSEADLASNDPFHIRMEELSRRIVAPAVNGKQYGTHWYYERANGQYKQETYKSTSSEKKRFEMLNPKNQLFKKVDLAKFWNIMNLHPDIASAGGQKAFLKFSSSIRSQWEKDETVFNQGFFEDIVSMAILFKAADRIVKKQEWYNSYKANIVAYTLSKIIFTVKRDFPEYQISYHNIWLKQSISSVWEEQIKIVSKIMYEHLIDENRDIENVTEWAKRQRCWESAKIIPIHLTKDFISELQLTEEADRLKKDKKKEQKMINDINKTVEVYNFGTDNWKKLLIWNNTHPVLNVQEIEFVKLAIAMEKGKVPSDKQSSRILQVLNHAREEGFPL